MGGVGVRWSGVRWSMGIGRLDVGSMGRMLRRVHIGRVHIGRVGRVLMGRLVQMHITQPLFHAHSISHSIAIAIAISLFKVVVLQEQHIGSSQHSRQIKPPEGCGVGGGKGRGGGRGGGKESSLGTSTITITSTSTSTIISPTTTPHSSTPNDGNTHTARPLPRHPDTRPPGRHARRQHKAALLPVRRRVGEQPRGRVVARRQLGEPLGWSGWLWE